MDVARENLLSGRVRFNQKGGLRYHGVLAREQTSGRGQRGRDWYAAPGESLCATYYFRRGLTDPQRAGELAFLAGVAVADTLQRLALGSQLPIREEAAPLLPSPLAHCIGLKWPNDVLLNSRKVGGILIEMVKAPDGEWVALVGVGVNVRVRALPPALVTQATSLALEGIETCDVEALGERIASALHAQADIRRDRGFAAILQRWRTYDQTPGRRYLTTIAGQELPGVASGIDETGALQLRLEDERVVTVTSASSLREQEPALSR